MEPTKASEAEAKPIKEVLGVVLNEKDPVDEILQKHRLWKTIRILVRVRRFIQNCRAKGKEKKITGPITTEETEKELTLLIKKAQQCARDGPKYEEDKLQLNLQPNSNGIPECRGRIQGDYPTYVSDVGTFAEKLVERAHLVSMHGGVGLTIAEIRQKYWIPRIRRLVKRVIEKCHGCKRFRVKALSNPPAGYLPKDRTEGDAPFQTVGLDYAGPITYRRKKSDGKAYILVYACSLTRALHLDLLPDLSAEEFIFSFKRLVARRGRPRKIYSDNANICRRCKMGEKEHEE